MLCGSLFQTVGPWYAKERWTDDLLWQKGFETDEYQRRNGVVGKEHKHRGCQQGIGDPIKPVTEEKQMEEISSWFVDTLAANGVHVEAEKHAHVLVTGSEHSGCVIWDTLDEPVRQEEKQRSPYYLMLTDGGRERTFTEPLGADRWWKRKNVHWTTWCWHMVKEKESSLNHLLLTAGGRERTFTEPLGADSWWKRKNVHWTTWCWQMVEEKERSLNHLVLTDGLRERKFIEPLGADRWWKRKKVHWTTWCWQMVEEKEFTEPLGADRWWRRKNSLNHLVLTNRGGERIHWTTWCWQIVEEKEFTEPLGADESWRRKNSLNHLVLTNRGGERIHWTTWCWQMVEEKEFTEPP